MGYKTLAQSFMVGGKKARDDGGKCDQYCLCGCFSEAFLEEEYKIIDQYPYRGLEVKYNESENENGKNNE